MLEVTCFHCGQVVQISPDVERCSVCGMNLRKLIGREQSSGYFYRRAADMAGSGNVLGALQEVQRGLAYVNSSELNLLGAILCKRLSRWEDMRHYVAAIPVDDPLRGEGEWLLRSNQARQRPAPPPPRGKAPVAIPVIPDSDALPVVMDEVAPAAGYRKPQRNRSAAPVFWLALLALLLGGGWLMWQGGLLGDVGLPGPQVAGPADAQVLGEQPAAPAATAAGEAPTPQPVTLPEQGGSAGAAPDAAPDAAPAEQVNSQAEDSTGNAAEEQAPPALLLPTPTVASNLAQTGAVSEAIASTSADLAVAAAALADLDWQQWLEQRNRADLAALPVTMRVEDDTLILEGTVPYAEQRAALEFEAKQAPGVQEVSIVNVKVRPPESYTVVEGDSLWAISVRIYGNADQVEELYAANRDQMTSAGDLRVGMVLNVPPVE